MKKEKPIYWTRHHVVPTSRGGTSDNSNIIMKTTREHRAYHVLFGNRTPEEIIELLTSGHYQLADRSKWSAWRILFDHLGPVEAAAIVKSEWTKDGSAFLNLSTDNT